MRFVSFLMCVRVRVCIYLRIYINLLKFMYYQCVFPSELMNVNIYKYSCILYDSLTNLLLVSVWRSFPLKWTTFQASFINHLNDVQKLKLLWTNKMKEEKREQKSIKKKKLLPEISFAINWRETTNVIFINLDLDAHSSSANLFTSPR